MEVSVDCWCEHKRADLRREIDQSIALALRTILDGRPHRLEVAVVITTADHQYSACQVASPSVQTQQGQVVCAG